MPDDQNTTQNPALEPISEPTSPQPAVGTTPEITPISEAPVMPPESLEAHGNGVISESNKEAPPKIDEIRVEMGNPQNTLENQGVANPAPETVNSPVETGGTAQSAPTPAEPTAQMGRNEPLSLVRTILKKAQEMIQTKKRKKLEKIMSMFTTKSKITNDEVEKLLHCSDATATRYLNTLEKEGKIKRNGKERGKYVSYSKI